MDWYETADVMTLSHSPIRDAEWIVRLRAGDETALREIMETHFAPIASLALRYVHSRDLASDVAQDAFIRLWEHREGLAPDTSIRAYLSRIARNRAVDMLRHDAHLERMEQRITNDYITLVSHSENHGSENVEHDEFHALVHAVADTLTPRVREVLLLYYDEQLNPGEIAEVLGVAPKTVYAQLRTALHVYTRALIGRWP